MLLDLKLPDGSGLTLLDSINEQQSQVVFSQDKEHDLIKAGCISAVLTKSKTSDKQLLSTIKEIIDNSHTGAST